MPEELERAIDVTCRPDADEDPVEAGTAEVHARIASQLGAQLANDLTRQTHVHLAAMAVSDLARPVPEGVGMSTALEA